MLRNYMLTSVSFVLTEILTNFMGILDEGYLVLNVPHQVFMRDIQTKHPSLLFMNNMPQRTNWFTHKNFVSIVSTILFSYFECKFTKPIVQFFDSHVFDTWYMNKFFVLLSKIPRFQTLYLASAHCSYTFLLHIACILVLKGTRFSLASATSLSLTNEKRTSAINHSN